MRVAAAIGSGASPSMCARSFSTVGTSLRLALCTCRFMCAPQQEWDEVAQIRSRSARNFRAVVPRANAHGVTRVRHRDELRGFAAIEGTALEHETAARSRRKTL